MSMSRHREAAHTGMAHGVESRNDLPGGREHFEAFVHPQADWCDY
jgi:hypothetical protein